MEQRLRVMQTPLQIVIVCPEEAGGVAVAEILQVRLGYDCPIVALPRGVIREAAALNNEWAPVLGKHRDANWYAELHSVRNSQVVIVDVFNASGATFESLRKLLEYLRIEIFCFFPLVDFDPEGSHRDAGTVQFATLLSWWNPRRVR
jgi:adenine/guanine phosphoribosyltransferase-like PRPP-binding protein